jgi:hypothetical protein
VAESKLGVYNNNVRNTRRAIDERYIFCDVGGGEFKPRIRVGDDRYTRNAWLQEYQRKVLLRVRGAPIISESEVILMYNGRKRTVYENASVSLDSLPLSRKDARLSGFVKFEKQDISKAPRIILPRSSRYNLRLGRYLKHTEKRYFKGINDAFGAHTSATVIKGFNNQRSARILREKWDRFRNPVAIGLDAKKFDMHVSPQALRWEHEFYNKAFESQELRRLLSWQLRNQGVAYATDGKVKFWMHGTRCSGDMNTSLGNCILMCGLVYAFARERDINIELANNGDDCVVIMDHQDLFNFMDGLAEWFNLYGFRMVAEEPVREFEQIEFCQTHPVWTVEGWKMMRNLTAVMRKDGICLIDVPNVKVLRKWMGGVGVCNLAAHCGVPVLQEMACYFMRNGLNCPDRMMQEIFRNTSMLNRIQKLQGKKLAITPEARASFFLATGMIPDLQVQMEGYFRNLDFDATRIRTTPDEFAGGGGILPNWIEDCIESPALIQ